MQPAEPVGITPVVPATGVVFSAAVVPLVVPAAVVSAVVSSGAPVVVVPLFVLAVVWPAVVSSGAPAVVVPLVVLAAVVAASVVVASVVVPPVVVPPLCLPSTLRATMLGCLCISLPLLVLVHRFVFHNDTIHATNNYFIMESKQKGRPIIEPPTPDA